MPPEKTKIELPAEDAEIFRVVMEHLDFFQLLVDNRVYKLEKTKVVLSISDPGIITDIDISAKLFQRKSKKTQ